MCSARNRVDIKIFDDLPEELSNLHKFLDMIKEINEINETFSPYLNPLVNNYWTIHENVVVYKHIKKDPNLSKRCFVYLKQIKYLLRDVDKYKKRSEYYKEKYIAVKQELVSAKLFARGLQKKLQLLEEENRKTFVPNIVYDKQFDKEFEIDVIENHYNEFKSRQICYDYGDNFLLSKNSLVKVCKSVIGFLNANGGTLYIGVEDNGIVNGVKFHSREHLDQFMKQIDNYLLNLKPVILDKFYDYKFWKIGDGSVVVLIIVQEQKIDKKRYLMRNSNNFYIRCHSITRKIVLFK